MNSVKQLSAEERIESHLKDRLSDLRLMLRGARVEDLEVADDGSLDTVIRVGDEEFRFDHEYGAVWRDEDGRLDLNQLLEDESNDINERLAERFYEYGLGFDYVAAGTFNDQEEGFFRYQLSTGGPGDEFRFFADAAGHEHRVEYWFLDWFDGAHRVLSGDDRALLDEVFDRFVELGVVESALESARP